MAQNLIDLRRRIRSVRNTQKSTMAMKTVSSVKLRRSVTEITYSRPALRKIESVLRRIKKISHQKHDHIESNDFLKERETGRTVLVAVSADKGLCGAFNARINAEAEAHFKELEIRDNESPLLVTVGNKATQYFSKRGYPFAHSYTSMMSRLKYEHALALSEYLQSVFLKPEASYIRSVELVYTEYVSTSRQEVKTLQLLPLNIPWKREDDDTENQDMDYIFEPSLEDIFNYLLPKYIDSMVYRILLQSSASENAARMVAMDKATRNASDMIQNLTLTLNKMRQASITNELLEIITATEALNQ
ncbi:MAG: ATP synthase F1 subunit gamma [Candidatus Omnitrophota bacterium]